MSRTLNLTPEDALALAIERHRRGELDDAQTIYQVLLDRWPDHAGVLSHMGVLQHQRGDKPRALALLRRAVAADPAAAGIWNNLGSALLASAEVDEAEQAFRRSIALGESPEAQSNLGRVLRRQKRWAESEAACRRALALAPEFGDAWHNLSLLLLVCGRVAEGIEAASQATRLLPPQKRRRDSYSRVLVMAGKVDEAAAVFRRWLEEEPDNAYVRHHLAACTGEAVPGRASDAYVESVFDQFASDFDAKLRGLHYRAPELVAEAVALVLPAPAREFDIADLGCGTGLCGPLLHGWARHLAGCDLSAAMLEQARQRGVYDELQKVELMQFLQAHTGRFDLVVSADTLCYFGALGDVMQATFEALRPGGRTVFTVEALSEDDAADHRLLPSGRYAHGTVYLRALLDAAGLRDERVAAAELRQEAGRPVRGWVVTAARVR